MNAKWMLHRLNPLWRPTTRDVCEKAIADAVEARRAAEARMGYADLERRIALAQETAAREWLSEQEDKALQPLVERYARGTFSRSTQEERAYG